MRRLKRVAATVGVIAAMCVALLALVIANCLPRVVHRATAVVINKEYVTFDKSELWFTDDDGRRTIIQPGEERQWRLYFRLDDFPERRSGTRNKLLAAEKDREAERRVRFLWGGGDGPEWLSSVNAGDKLMAVYQQSDGGDVEVLTVEPAETTALSFGGFEPHPKICK